MSRSYTFKRDDGSIEVMSLSEASKKYHEPDIKRRFDEIIENSKNRRMVKDGFTPGWQENINAYAGGRMEYDKMLKERGLVEIGREYVPSEKKDVIVSPCANEEFVRACIDNGIELSDTEADAIKSGEYFKE